MEILPDLKTNELYKICAPDGTLVRDDLPEDVDREFLLDTYRKMKLSRKFDLKAVKLQRQGRLGTYAPCKGQEGCQVGSVLALERTDPLFPTYRETAALLTRGVSLENILLYWSGDERGSGGFEDYHVFPISIPVGSHGLHAVGASYALQFRGRNQLPVVYFGDGATSEGDMLEAMNFGGVWETPVIFFCQNNQWAISVSREEQTVSETLAQKAYAFGFEGYRVDGNDPLATYQIMKESRRKALDESTPVFIEAVTYRLGDHTTADDASRYRSEEEVQTWEKRDPVNRIYNLLKRHFEWSQEQEDQLVQELDETIQEAIERFESIEPPDPADMFSYTFEDSIPELTRQQNELLDELNYE